MIREIETNVDWLMCAMTRRFGVVIALLVASSGCSFDECDQDGEDWCEGNVRNECYYEEVHGGADIFNGNTLEQDNCSQYGATCIEERLDGHDYAYCGYTERECPPGYNIDLCIGDKIGFCGGLIYPHASFNSLECERKDLFCVETVDEDDDYDATCSLFSETCEEDDPSFCHEDESGNYSVFCYNSVWRLNECDTDRPCCIKTDGVANWASCVSIEDHDEMCVDP